MIINRYDIISKLNIRVEAYNKQITFANCSDDYIVYSTDWIGGEIYLFSIKEKNSSRILELEASESIRSILIKYNTVYFDFASKKNIDKENKPRIFAYDLNQNTLFEINTMNTDNNSNFSWLKSSSEKITMDYSINNGSNIVKGIMYLEKE